MDIDFNTSLDCFVIKKQQAAKVAKMRKSTNIRQ